VTDPAYIAVGGVDERGSRKPPSYVPDIFMSGVRPAIDFVGPAWMVLTYAFDAASDGFYNEGFLSTEPEISPADYPNMIRLPNVQYARTTNELGMFQVSAAARNITSTIIFALYLAPKLCQRCAL
jgi:hypothetical protein